MKNKELLINSIKERMEGNVRLPHQASSIAYDIFLLLFRFKANDDLQVKNLVSGFVRKLQDWEMEDLLNKQVSYALKIANYDGELEYEEMHKLFSLCNEVYALEYIGLDFDISLKHKYNESIRNRFKRERKKSKLVAEDKFADWKKDFWWYKENLNN